MEFMLLFTLPDYCVVLPGPVSWRRHGMDLLSELCGEITGHRFQWAIHGLSVDAYDNKGQ